jgi:hypothetical protein
MAYTIDDLNALKAAIAQGVREVEYADKKVTYRSLNEMLQILKLIEQELYPNQNKGGRVIADFNNGL